MNNVTPHSLDAIKQLIEQLRLFHLQHFYVEIAENAADETQRGEACAGLPVTPHPSVNFFVSVPTENKTYFGALAASEESNANARRRAAFL